MICWLAQGIGYGVIGGVFLYGVFSISTHIGDAIIAAKTVRPPICSIPEYEAADWCRHPR